jgi:CxxC motif-containing protein (DUF1111 family)
MTSKAQSAQWPSIILAIITTASLGIPAHSAKMDREPPVPLPGLTSAQQTRFEEGRQLFEMPFFPRDGLGPVFNARACEACHHIPSIGGHGPGYRGNIRFVQPGHVGSGILLHDRAVAGGPAEALPENAILSKRRPSTLLGLGLVELIPDGAILANADTDDRDGDGIRGRAAMKDGRLLRFGSQAHIGSVMEFVADALRQEMGLTSPVMGFDQEPAHGPGLIELPFFARGRGIPEPNVTMDTVAKLTDFVSLLAPPVRASETVGQVTRGERLFQELSCARCHVPVFRTSVTPLKRTGEARLISTAALLDREVRVYSDFLLHDMGQTLDDGVALGVARSGEYRTPPLWGVRFRMHQLLHDARANNLEQAIIYHGGEAARARNQFLALPAPDRQAIIEFLKTL